MNYCYNEEIVIPEERHGRAYPDMKQLHQAYPMSGADQAVLQSMMMLNPALREQMIQDAAKV